MEFRLGDELRVLHVHQVLGIEAFGRELGISEYADLPRPVRQVLQCNRPYFMRRPHGHIVQGPAPDSLVFAHEFRIACSVVALGFVLVQGLADRLPAGAPEVPGFFVPQVDIPAGLIKLVKCITEDSSSRAALHKAVAAGIHRDDRAVVRRSEIVRPGCGRIGIGDDILSGFLVKIAVLHMIVLLMICPLICRLILTQQTFSRNRNIKKAAGKTGRSLFSGYYSISPSSGASSGAWPK